MRVLLIGANGQLGHDLVRVFHGGELIPLTRSDLDVTDANRVRTTILTTRPDVVINTTAYNRVDDAEHEVDQAFAVNTFGARDVALACRTVGSILVHFSTDYVFDGTKGEPYLEDDLPCPLNVYGVSKLAGEYFVRTLTPAHFLIRTSGLYGLAGSRGKGGNFVETMIRLGCKQPVVRVVADQVITPTNTFDLAAVVCELISTRRYGLYHITNSGRCSWYEFAQAIFVATSITTCLEPVSSAAYGAPANRPLFSVLAHHELLRAGLVDLRPWQDALAAHLAERAAILARTKSTR
jgi:dTDP-4-dehydrorhamnose reductase